MYYKEDLGYVYPERSDEHMINVKECGAIGSYSIEQGSALRPVICLPASAFN